MVNMILSEEEMKLVTESRLINEKKIKFHRYQIVTDIILIIVCVGIGIYVYNNIEQLKLLSNDVCKLCMIKTNSTCYPNSFNPINLIK